MKSVKTILAALILVFTVSGISSCKKDEDDKCGTDTTPECAGVVEMPMEEIMSPAGGNAFQVDEFMDVLEANVKGQVVGYQIAVSYQGKIIAARSDGFAKRAPDCAAEMTDCSIFNIASQTKTITTVALMKLLSANGLTVDSPVAPHLPASWQRTAYMNRLCFRHFLGHRTAFPGANSATVTTSDWNACKTFVESTPQPAFCPNQNTPDQNGFDYKNCNLALMRIIIPTLWKNLAFCPQELKNAPQITDDLCKKYYELYVQTFVLGIAGVQGSLTKPANNDVLFYEWVNLNAGDTYIADWTAHGGGGGWCMNAASVAKLMNAINENEDVITAENLAIMKSHPTLGWRFGFINTTNTSKGRAYGHGGDLNSQGGDMHGNYAMLPGGIYVSIMINSPEPGGGQSGSLFNYIINAYEAAF